MRSRRTVAVRDTRRRMYKANTVTELAPSPTGNRSKVAILMGTFNGEQFLSEQLDSIRRQTHTGWELHISDDGSCDKTLDIIHDARKEWTDHLVTLRAGPQKGFVANFLSLACDPAIQADHYAFSDQDDVWDNDKLERAINWLSTIPTDKPAMYCARTRLIDESGKVIGQSPLFKRTPSFKNALVQSIAGANTMVFNNAARSLLLRAGFETPVVSHDWWVYLLITGCQGVVFYDSTPGIGYRQHETNLVGSNVGWGARANRIAASLRGRFTNWNDTNLAALKKVNTMLSSENHAAFIDFSHLRNASPIHRLLGLIRSGLYRQTVPGNLSLFAAALIGKI